MCEKVANTQRTTVKDLSEAFRKIQSTSNSCSLEVKYKEIRGNSRLLQSTIKLGSLN